MLSHTLSSSVRFSLDDLSSHPMLLITDRNANAFSSLVSCVVLVLLDPELRPNGACKVCSLDDPGGEIALVNL